MIFIPCVSIYFLISIAQVVTYLTWRHPRVVLSSLVLKVPVLEFYCDRTYPLQSDMAPFLRLTAIFLSNGPDSPNIPDEQGAAKKLGLKIEAVEYCLDNFEAATEPVDKDESFRKLVRRYRRFTEDGLTKLLTELEAKETELIRQSAIGGNGKLRLNRI